MILENNEQIADVEDREHRELLYQLDLSTECDRLSTFKWWPCSAAGKEKELARAGFYYLGNKDRTQCYYCKIVVCNWKATTKISDFHEDNCCMRTQLQTAKVDDQIITQLATTNIAQATDDDIIPYVMTSLRSDKKLLTSQQCIDDNSEDEFGGYDPDIDIYPDADVEGAQLMRDMYPCDDPKVVAMKKLTARISTFTGNASWHGNEFHIEAIAESGFFYQGVSDLVRCWYCGVTMEDWYFDGVDPWKSHASSNHSCEFLKRNRSYDFIIEAAACPQLPPLVHDSAVHHVVKPVLVKSRSDSLPLYVEDTRPKEVRDKEELEQAMEKEYVKDAMSHAGYSRSEVVEVLRRQILKRGVAYQSYQGLLAALNREYNSTSSL